MVENFSNALKESTVELVEISEIELREEAEIEWFPGDWVICRTN